MKILIISTSDSKGGAAKVAQTLCVGMRSRGHEVTFLVFDKDDESVESTVIETKPRRDENPRSIANRLIHRLGVNQLGLNSPFPRRTSNLDFSDFDVIHLHDIVSFNVRDLPWLTRQAPVVWTIHSMYPLTGNCVFSFDCDRWKKSCGQCPQFGKWPLLWYHRDGSSLNIKAKRWFYNRSQFHAVGVSEWISQKTRESVMGHLPVTTIQNAIDTDVYTPIDKAKAALGIPEDHFAIAFSVASNPADDRKGVDLILQAATKLQTDRPVTFMPMAIGKAVDDLAEALGESGNILPPRHLSSAQELSLYYSAADVIWHPSRADTSSMVSMEAMACGTPVIAAAVGGVPEVVGDCGILIEPNNSTQLATVTDQFIGDTEQQQALSSACRPRVLEHFSIDRFLNEHEAVYQQSVIKENLNKEQYNEIEEPIVQ